MKRARIRIVLFAIKTPVSVIMTMVPNKFQKHSLKLFLRVSLKISHKNINRSKKVFKSSIK